METLSYHRYIRFDVSASLPDETCHSCPSDARAPLRWALRRLDWDALVAASIITAWSADSGVTGPDRADEGADWFYVAYLRRGDAPNRSGPAASGGVLVFARHCGTAPPMRGRATPVHPLSLP